MAGRKPLDEEIDITDDQLELGESTEDEDEDEIDPDDCPDEDDDDDDDDGAIP